MAKGSLVGRLLYAIRDFRSRKMFEMLSEHCSGSVLDVGGGNFYSRVRTRVNVDKWTCLEHHAEVDEDGTDDKFTVIYGDGCNMPFENDQFDSIVNLQVLEHVLEPLKMVSEMERVLRPGGHMVLLIPQTATIHLSPHHYYNFTRHWIELAFPEPRFETLLLEPLGGVWSSMASHLVFFFFQSVRHTGMSPKEVKRNAMFYILYPFMCLWALINIPVCMFLGLGDLQEEPNNHLVVVKKRLLNREGATAES